MGWVWSDELARDLLATPEFAALVPASWTAKPSAFATSGDEDLATTVRRLLGLGAASDADQDSDLEPRGRLTLCDCDGKRSSPTG